MDFIFSGLLDVSLLSLLDSKEPIKVAKPKPKRPSEEQKKTEKAKVELKRRIPQEFQDFSESKFITTLPLMLRFSFELF